MGIEHEPPQPQYDETVTVDGVEYVRGSHGKLYRVPDIALNVAGVEKPSFMTQERYDEAIAQFWEISAGIHNALKGDAQS